jgi:hypothetical protein
VPPHTGGEVVDPEQVLEFLRLPGPPLHRVKQGELAVQQRLAAPGQVPEDVADALAQPRLAHGRFHRGLLDRHESLPDLADLVRAGGQLGSVGGHVHVLAGRQPAHHIGQPFMRQFQRRIAERGQFPDDAPADHERHEDGQNHREQAQPARQDELQVRVVRVGRCLGGDHVRGLRGGLGQACSDAAHRGFPLQRLDRGRAGRPGVAHHPVFQPGQGGGRLRADVVGVVAAVLRLQVRQRLGVEGPARPHQLGEQLATARPGRRR